MSPTNEDWRKAYKKEGEIDWKQHLLILLIFSLLNAIYGLTYLFLTGNSWYYHYTIVGIIQGILTFTVGEFIFIPVYHIISRLEKSSEPKTEDINLWFNASDPHYFKRWNRFTKHLSNETALNFPLGGDGTIIKNLITHHLRAWEKTRKVISIAYVFIILAITIDILAGSLVENMFPSFMLYFVLQIFPSIRTLWMAWMWLGSDPAYFTAVLLENSPNDISPILQTATPIRGPWFNKKAIELKIEHQREIKEGVRTPELVYPKPPKKLSKK